jgi:uncharacterized integral membrane protein (TIGR00697 family)
MVSAFVALNLMAPIASNKVIDLGITFAAGSMLIGISYGILDIINDWRGKAAARWTIESALIIRLVFFLVVIPLVLVLPEKSAPEGFSDFLVKSTRLFVAGWASLFVGGWIVNTSLFTALKEKMRGRNFTLRYLTTIFPTIVAGNIVYGVLGFAGDPKVDLLAIIAGTTVARILIGVAITPVVALGRAGVRRYAGNPTA